MKHYRSKSTKGNTGLPGVHLFRPLHQAVSLLPFGGGRSGGHLLRPAPLCGERGSGLDVHPWGCALCRLRVLPLNQKISDLARQNHSLSRLQAKGCIDSAIFIERSNRNNKLIEELRFELRQLQEPDRVSETIDQTNLLLDLLDDAQPMLEFEPSIFKSMIKEIAVYPEKFSFVLSNGLVLCEMR